MGKKLIGTQCTLSLLGYSTPSLFMCGCEHLVGEVATKVAFSQLWRFTSCIGVFLGGGVRWGSRLRIEGGTALKLEGVVGYTCAGGMATSLKKIYLDQLSLHPTTGGLETYFQWTDQLICFLWKISKIFLTSIDVQYSKTSPFERP